MIDFVALKQRVTIEDGARFLNLQLKKENNQFRSICPACDTDNARALVITPEKGLFYCFKSGKGGDVINMVAHVRQIGIKQAGEELSTLTPAPQQQAPAPAKEEVAGDTTLQPLKNLKHEHEDTQKLFDKVSAVAIGAGYCSKGLMQGMTAIPVRLPNGQLVGYIGVKDVSAVKVPKAWRVS